MTRFYVSTLLLIFSSFAHSQDYKPTSVDKDVAGVFSNYAEKSRGWHWKEPFPELELVEPELMPPPPPVAKAETQKPESPKPEGPKPLSSDWIRQNMSKYLDAAVDDPTPQNVSNYLYLQRYAMDASDRFAQVFKRVSLSDPNLDSNNNRPLWSGASIALDKAASDGKDNVLKSLAQKTGIWFFFRSDCNPCHQQAPVLALFAKKYGFAVLPISIDGKDMPNSPFPSFSVDKGQAKQFNVVSTPTVFLARPPDKIYTIGEGLMSLADFQDRVVELSMQAGLITEKEYKTTRGDKKELLPSLSAPSVASLTPEVAKDPNKVSDYLRQLMTRKPQ